MHDLGEKGAVCLYGGEPHHLIPYIEWAHKAPERYVIWIEHHLHSEELSSSILRRVWVHDPFGYEEMFKKYVWECVFLPFTFLSLEEGGEGVMQHLLALQLGVHALASAYADLGEGYMRNVLANMQHPQRPAYILKDRFSGIPALICGAGPSLDVDAVRALKNKALIFGCGSATLPLVRAEAAPHLRVAVDPDPPRERYSLIPESIPLCYSRGCASSLVEGTTALWIDDIGRYPLERWLFDCEDRTPLDGGWNAVTCAIALALLCGCSPIILSGVDLSYIGDKRYVEGVIAKDEEPPSDWLVAAEWIAECIKKHPDTRWIHVWNGGRTLPAERVSSLQECPLEHTYDITERVQALLNNAPTSTYSAKGLQEHIENAHEALIRLIEGYSLDAPFAAALWEEALEQNIFYEKFLSPLWDVWKHVFARQGQDRMHRVLFLHRVLICLLKSCF